MPLLLALLQTGLLEDTIECANWHVYAEFSSNRNCAGLSSVLELPVAALGSDMLPPILLQHTYDVADLHGESNLPGAA
jgi:hypothetical protein